MPLEITIGRPLIPIDPEPTVIASEPDGQAHDGRDKGLFFFDTRVVGVWRGNGSGRVMSAGG